MDFPVLQKTILKRVLPVWGISGFISSFIFGGILAAILFILYFFHALSGWLYALGVIIAAL